MQYDEDDEFIAEMIANGYLIPVGFDDEGEVLFQTTPKFREDFPDMFAEQIAETNTLMYDLWVMGLVDITVKEDVNDWIVIPNEKTFTCDLEQLTSAQRNMIRQLRYRTAGPESGII